MKTTRTVCSGMVVVGLVVCGSDSNRVADRTRPRREPATAAAIVPSSRTSARASQPIKRASVLERVLGDRPFATADLRRNASAKSSKRR